MESTVHVDHLYGIHDAIVMTIDKSYEWALYKIKKYFCWKQIQVTNPEWSKIAI